MTQFQIVLFVSFSPYSFGRPDLDYVDILAPLYQCTCWLYIILICAD